MLRIDKAILKTNEVICKNISKLDDSDRGLLSQNILSQLRNFVEYIASKIYADGNDIDPNNYPEKKTALKNLKTNKDLRFLYKFHAMLQISVSHYTLGEDESERLMLKYYAYLLKIKKILKDNYDLEVLNNIEEFPLNRDTELMDYYTKIADKIETLSSLRKSKFDSNRFYIQKIKPFFIKQKIYYEITFIIANSKASKFDRKIAFTKHEISSNYAVRFSIQDEIIDIFGKNMSIQIIDDWEVAIRSCEWNNFGKILGLDLKVKESLSEYRKVMRFLTKTKMSLTELVCSEQDYYDFVKNQIIEPAISINIYRILDQCRKIISADYIGANIIRYLLYIMNNRILKNQLSNEQCTILSNLYLGYGCKPFDDMPYCTSLLNHNPRFFDLFECIPVEGREHELFARLIKNNTEIEGILFTPISEIYGYDDINKLIQKHNRNLIAKHVNRRLEIYQEHIYIKGYADDCKSIIEKLKELTSSGISQYTSSVDSWIKGEAYSIDDDSKKEALRNMFKESHVALIYGSAGTGKSTMIRHISNFWAEYKKFYLANTHPAVENMKRKVTAANGSYNTIAKFLSYKNRDTECDILFIDECSTVSNKDMYDILKKAKFKLLVLVGDVYQIESIYFGNWFNIARKFLPKTAIFELIKPYRTNDSNLLTMWERVRNIDDTILESLTKNDYVAKLDESLLEQVEKDEIILCLNYDGPYGINNINRFLQNNNPNEEFVWGINTYKIGDPVLFNESNLFSPLIHNNSKGEIANIKLGEQEIWFDIELEKSINEIDASKYSFDLVGESESGNSIISFSVSKNHNTDEDDDDNDSVIVPFQVAYAVSIHKAQGLEYESVKIIITNEVE